MYGKIFTQIYDSSIAENYQTRLVFQDLIILSDMNGVVDMTHEAISRRTNVPIEVVRQAITELELPDPRSRSPVEAGARIVRLDEHRDWGWIIVNHQRFRDLSTETARREKTRDRVNRFRKRNNLPTSNALVTGCNAGVTPCNAPVTLGNAEVHIQIQKQITDTDTHREGEAPSSEIPDFEQAFAMTMNANIPRDFCFYVHEDWSGRQGTDGNGVHVPWLPYVTKRWRREQVEWKNGTHNGNKKKGVESKQLQEKIEVRSL